MINYFNYDKNNILNCENVNIIKIIEEVNTPLYIYSSKAILDNFELYKKAFSGFDPLICFAVKANANLNILSLLKDSGAGADIVSSGELFRALEAGIHPKKIVYAGVGKTDAEIESALRANILMFNTESYEEIVRINALSLKLHKKACIAIRVNPDINPKTHPYISTGLKKNKFGININNVKELINSISGFKNIVLMGIHMHIGSQLIDLSPLYDSLQKIKLLINELKENNISIKYLNLGGGLGIKYSNEKEPTPDNYIKLIKPILESINCKIIMEPGRSIIGNAGILVTRVINNKKTENKNFVIVDAGMNDLIRPSLYDAYHEIIPVKKSYYKNKDKFDIVGPICETGDFFAHDRILPQVAVGEYLAVLSAGAYGFSMSSNYNSRLRAAEILVKENSFKIIRRRETFAELIQNEHINTIPFTKLNGNGNDFILIDNRHKILKKNLSEFSKKICTPKYSIGADGVIFIENSKYADFLIRIFNMDGTEAEMCGNGARCAAKFAFDKKIVITPIMNLETKSGMIIADINLD
ncbi:MAG: diaminopimelate decarboxylase, partial [Candidatus Firestonebacteria bacterium]|nr:diaminopimelate decarboxylase [Candidatus Firestonebacteria bacterium]